MWPRIVTNSYNKTNQIHWFLKFILGLKFYTFHTVPLSIIRSFSLYTQQWYVIQVCWQLASGIRMESWSCSQAVWHIPWLCVQWKTPDDGQRNCPKHVALQSKNKFEKLVHLVGFIIINPYVTIKNHLLFCDAPAIYCGLYRDLKHSYKMIVRCFAVFPSILHTHNVIAYEPPAQTTRMFYL